MLSFFLSFNFKLVTVFSQASLIKFKEVLNLATVVSLETSSVKQVQHYPNITGNGLFLNILKFQLKVTLSKFKVLTNFIKSRYSFV